jgi:predicted DNA-binding transcriptional regulator YafY
MERIERIVLFHRLLTANRYGLTTDRLIEETGCSRSTLYRDLNFLRDYLGAPLEHEGEPLTWRYTRTEKAFELPGVWLNADEVYALLLAEQVLKRSQGGLLSDALGRLMPRVEKMLGSQAKQMERLRVLRAHSRQMNEASFRVVAQGVLDRKRLKFRYRARSTDQVQERRVHPQRLTHYRDNWYLDAYDDTRSGLRSFALDRIQNALLEDEPARDIDAAEIDQQLAAGYGIFSGAVRDVAVIRFSAHAARWVSEEKWHSQQTGRFLSDGSYELRVPYSNPRELLMDVLRHAGDAQVLAPVALREQMRAMLSFALANYA